VTLLVHGCRGSSGQFRGLAQVLAFHGQQSACFTYDDRARLTESATVLRSAIDQLAASGARDITVIGHSQGSLIARKAVTEPLANPLPEPAASLKLVTVSGPFSGIESARPCGDSLIASLTLGLVPLSCYFATGPKWQDITYSSAFIRDPGALSLQVVEHLKIDTDERGSCRRVDGERCLESDDVFSLTEQSNHIVDTSERTTRVQVEAGHVEIVGDKKVAPIKLISVLQEHSILRATPSERSTAFDKLLTAVYLETE
jgi:pimeloyl-ACP methyl ester carboxylesterase